MLIVGPLEFYDTFMWQANGSKTTTDVNLILGGFDDAASGMESIFFNGVCTLGDFSQSGAYVETTFTYGGTDALDGCNHHEFNTLAWRLDSSTAQNDSNTLKSMVFSNIINMI